MNTRGECNTSEIMIPYLTLFLCIVWFVSLFFRLKINMKMVDNVCILFQVGLISHWYAQRTKHRDTEPWWRLNRQSIYSRTKIHLAIVNYTKLLWNRRIFLNDNETVRWQHPPKKCAKENVKTAFSENRYTTNEC